MELKCPVGIAITMTSKKRVDTSECTYSPRRKPEICRPCIEDVRRYVQQEADRAREVKCVVCTMRKPMSGRDLCKNCQRRMDRYARRNSPPVVTQAFCGHCGAPYLAHETRRRPSEYCSPKCRQKAYRERKKGDDAMTTLEGREICDYNRDHDWNDDDQCGNCGAVLDSHGKAREGLCSAMVPPRRRDKHCSRRAVVDGLCRSHNDPSIHTNKNLRGPALRPPPAGQRDSA